MTRGVGTVAVTLRSQQGSLLDAEADRLVSLRGSRVAWDRYPDDPDFIVLADTQGNRFCIVDLGHEDA